MLALYLLLALVALLVAPLLLRWARARTRAVRAALAQSVLWLLGGVLLLLVLTGRLNVLLAGVAVVVPVLLRALHLLQFLPLLKRLLAQLRGGHAPRDSTIATRSLRVTLDHESGVMRGEVLGGQYRGRSLDGLTASELERLRAELRQIDPESVPLLDAFCERMRPGAGAGGASADSASGATSGGVMSASEAYAILGLQPGAARDEIIGAHRRLMQKLHPDRGGSDYLAARVNAARDCLLAG